MPILFWQPPNTESPLKNHRESEQPLKQRLVSLLRILDVSPHLQIETIHTHPGVKVTDLSVLVVLVLSMMKERRKDGTIDQPSGQKEREGEGTEMKIALRMSISQIPDEGSMFFLHRTRMGRQGGAIWITLLAAGVWERVVWSFVLDRFRWMHRHFVKHQIRMPMTMTVTTKDAWETTIMDRRHKQCTDQLVLNRVITVTITIIFPRSIRIKIRTRDRILLTN